MTGTRNNFIMEGDGAESVLKRKDNSCVRDNQELFKILTAGAGEVDAFEVRNILIDDNAAGNPIINEGGNYSYEHCSIFRFSPTSTAKMKSIVFEKVTFDDPVADCINFSTVNIMDFEGDEINVLSRSRVRSDICFSNAIENFSLSNSILTKFEAEWNTAPGFVSHVKIENTTVKDSFDIAGHTDPGRFELEVSDCDLNFRDIRVANAHIKNSIIRLRKDADIRKTDKTVFTGCEFYHIITNSIAPYDVSRLTISSETTGTPTKVYFNGCSFKIDTTEQSISEKSEAVFMHTILPEEMDSQSANFDGCWFDERFGYSVYNDRGGILTARDCDFGGITYGLLIGGDASYGSKLYLDGGKFDRVKSEYPLRISNSVNVTVSIKNLALPQDKSAIASNSYPVSNIKILENKRVIICDSEPTAGALKGDTAVMKTPDGIRIWVAAGTGSSAADAGWLEINTFP
jgi:hypothetical protein